MVVGSGGRRTVGSDDGGRTGGPAECTTARLRSLASVKQAALRDAITLVLTRRPRSTARYLADTIGVNKGSVNAVLYKYPQRFTATDEATPRWSVRATDPGTQ